MVDLLHSFPCGDVTEVVDEETEKHVQFAEWVDVSDGSSKLLELMLICHVNDCVISGVRVQDN